MSNIKSPAKDGLDPQALKKTIDSEGELIAEEQLDEDLAVTGAPPKGDGTKNAPQG
ncbi:MAG: hypothetical protein V2J26_04820 [Pacificimonas sp.]|jgi:hypothetical protein|nr:hypothetical protein [Pacificimonas sp.]